MQNKTIDPITLEVIWNRFLSVANEQQDALIRTAFSTIVRESQDLACGMFDTQGRMIAQSLSGTPGHINAMATSMQHFLAAFPPDRLSPGDVLITNDPWQTAGQINDITITTPVFKQDRLVALFANTCHSADIGGRILSAEAREVFEEGLRIPIMKLFDRGEPNRILMQIVRTNVRQPDEIIRRSETAVRAEIAKLPSGEWSNETWSDGFEEPIVVRCKVEVKGDEIFIDFTGSSPQSSRGINVVLNYTHAYASFAVKAAICPDVPHNEGSFRPVHVSAPEGSILNALDPAPVASRQVIGHFIPSAIFAALSGAMPGRLMAPGADPIWLSVWRGQNPPFTLTLFQVGGTGARPSKDGLNAVGFPSGVAGVPAEIIESLSPVVLRRRQLRPDSGGTGKWRGGLGQLTEFTRRGDGKWSVSSIADRTVYPAPGLLGGQAGATGEVLLGDGTRLHAKALVELKPGDVIHINLPGGGGYGCPFERDAERVRWDVIEGYITAEEAEREYGVAIRYNGNIDELVKLPDGWEIDRNKTAELRRTKRA
jgi:N-methylhydantoinase B